MAEYGDDPAGESTRRQSSVTGISHQSQASVISHSLSQSRLTQFTARVSVIVVIAFRFRLNHPSRSVTASKLVMLLFK